MENTRIDFQRQKIRILTSGYYDLQSLRIQTGNRIVASIRPDLKDDIKLKVYGADGDDTTEDEEGKSAAQRKRDKERDKVISKLLDEYKRVTEDYIEEFKGRGSVEKSIRRLGSGLAYIKSELDYRMVSTYDQLKTVEEDALKTLSSEVKKHPMWDAFFADVHGCGPLMAAICLSYIDINVPRTASALWKYAGLDVVDGVGRNRTMRVTQTYTDKDGEIKEKQGLGYNPMLKTKLCGVLGSSFLRVKGGADSGYGKLYYDYKNRIENRPDCAEYSKLHIHRMATRYAVKIFLKDLYNVWRVMEGYELRPEYAVEYLDRNEHGFCAERKDNTDISGTGAMSDKHSALKGAETTSSQEGTRPKLHGGRINVYPPTIPKCLRSH